mgnify:FL=1
MKKISWLGIMMCVLMSASVFGTTVSIPNTNVNPGTTTVQIPINIDNANSIAGFQFTVTFDNSVLNATGAVAGSLTNGWLLQVNPQAGQISVIGASSTALGSVSGSLSILQFNVVGNPGNSTNLSFTVHKLADTNAQHIAHNAVNGNFAVSGYRISGYVSLTGGTSLVSAASLNLTGTVNKTTNPDSNGYYEFTDLMPGNYTITPVLNRYTFSPVNKTYTPLNSSQTNQNFTGTFQAQLNISSLYGIPNPSTGTHIYASGTLISASVNSPISGPSGTRYVCSGWTGTGSVPSSGTSNSTSFTIYQDSTLTWNWKTQYLLTYSAEPATCGTITVNPTAQENWYDTGQIITCTYVQNPGYIFEKWLINGVEAGSNPTLTVTMNTPKQITAVFKQVGFVLELDRNIVDVVLDADTFVETQVLISVNPVGQYSKVVNLSAEKIPETGIALSFHPGNGVVPFDSILNIHLSESIKPDTYPLEITGASEDGKNTYDIAVIAKTKVYIPDTYCANIKGETCLVPINISTAKGLAGFQIKIIYDKNVLNVMNVKQGELTTNWNINDSTNQGEILIKGVNKALQGLEGGKGSICTVTFSVVGNIPEEGVPIILESVNIADKEARSMPYVSENGIVLPGIKGDFNHDSIVDIFDVILCLRQALEIDPSVDNADMNKDGVVDIFDVILVLRKALGID